MFKICLCAKFRSYPKESHLSVIKGILRYLKGTIGLGLLYPKCDKCNLIGFLDANFAERKVDWKNVNDTCHFLGQALTLWHSKKQNLVTLFMTNVKYIVKNLCCAQSFWMKQTLNDFGLCFEHVLIKCYNTSVIRISKNPMQHSRPKHIEIMHHFLKDHVQKR